MKAAGVWTIAALIALTALSLWAQPVADAPADDAPAATAPADPEVEADDLIRELLTQPPTRNLTTRPTTRPATAPEPVEAVEAPGEVLRPIPLPPGAVIADRVGRLVPEDDSPWWSFHFESEQNVLREPPIRILPNRLLERMEGISDQGERAGLKFRVSGEVTQYRGQRYLLLRKFIVEQDMGALRP